MSPFASQKDALLPLLNDLYQQIYALEMDHKLWAGKNDYRPRIELFHDAIRAYTSGEQPYGNQGRLTLENLSADIEALRKVQAAPLRAMPQSPRQSVSTAVVKPAPRKNSSPYSNRRQLSTELKILYKNYTVMFVALLAETADMNHASRVDEKDAIVTELSGVKDAMGQGSTVNLQKIADYEVLDPEIRDIIGTMLPKGVVSQDEALNAIKSAQNFLDGQIQDLEQVHTQWLSGQLASYQEGKDFVQQMMRQGLNMAGKFLQESMQQGMDGPGRGM
jgi:hypothetical protein